ncbi:MAG: hypothetical protein EBU46_07605 [Nitrosomonadaceae bacterium]|nr:hypothetical protein [Nitrosomonadaceae bacterium]
MYYKLALLLVIACCISTLAYGAESLVGLSGLVPDSSGFVAKEWQGGTLITIDKNEFVSVKSYNGQVFEGKAHGYGRLEFGAPFTPPTGSGLVYTLNPLFGLMYAGNFQNGLPYGRGILLNRASFVTLDGDFSGFAANGPVTISIGNRPTIFAIFKDGKLGDGPLKIFLYPSNSDTPSKVFLGSFTNGKQIGTWTALPWYKKGEYGEMFGYEKSTRYSFKDGSKANCTEELSYEPTTAGNLSALTGTPFDRFWNIDTQTQSRSAICESMMPDGWTYAYKADFANSRLEPIGCKDPENIAGQFTVGASNSMHCTTTKMVKQKSNNFFDKVLREIKRTPNNVKKAFYHTGDELSQEFEKFICGLGGKEPGKNCNINVQVGVTISLPEKNYPAQRSNDQASVATVQRSQANIYKEIDSGTDSRKAWVRAAADVYSLCVEKCSLEYSAYSLLRLEQLEFEVTSGSESDLRYRRIASIMTDATDIMERVMPHIPIASTIHATWRANKLLERLELAGDAIDQLPPVEFASKESIARTKAQAALYKIGFTDVILKELAPSYADFWKETYYALFPELPFLSSFSQVKILHDLGINIEDFARTHQRFNDSDKFIDAAVNTLIQPLGGVWPPVKTEMTPK